MEQEKKIKTRFSLLPLPETPGPGMKENNVCTMH